jgi:ribonuclease HII
VELWKSGYRTVGGIDEAGRGSWAGPVFAAVVVFSPDDIPCDLIGCVRDSKQLTPKQRHHLTGIIKNVCLDWGVGKATNGEIDSLGIVPATCLATQRALNQLSTPPDFLLLDYLIIADLDTPQVALVRGDQQVFSIAAASILAKTSRDEFMNKMDTKYPAYSFKNNKGYGTAAHLSALMRTGTCPIHRMSYKPVMAITQADR